MRLREVNFDRHCGKDGNGGRRRFDDTVYVIDFDPDTHLIRITPKGGGETLLLVATNVDMYPYPAKEESPSEPGPARALPGKPRQRT